MAQEETKTDNGNPKQSKRTKGKKSGTKKKSDSPVSPLQLSMDGDVNSTESRSCTSSRGSFRSLEFEDNRIISCPSDLMLDNANVSDLLKVQQQLKNSLDKNRALQDSLCKSDNSVKNLSSHIFDSENAIVSCRSKSNMLNDLIEKTFAQAVAFVKTFDADHDLKRAVAACPKSSDYHVQRYLESVRFLEDAASSGESASSMSLKRLQDTLQDLANSSLLDKVWIARLGKTASLLKKVQTSLQEENADQELLDVATQHLERLLKRIITDYGMIIPLQVSIPDLTENAFKPPPPLPPLPPQQVKILREIVQVLAAKGKLEKCMDVYQEARSLKAIESLQILGLDYLKTSSPESVDKLRWKELESYILLWTQHLEVLIKVLLTVEHDLCRQVFYSFGSNVWTKCFSKLSMQIGLESFLRFGEAVAKSREDPQKLPKLLDMIGVLQRLEHTLENQLDTESCKEAIQRLQKVKVSLYHAVSRVFRLFRLQMDMENQLEISSSTACGLLDCCCENTMSYMSDLISDKHEPILKQVMAFEHHIGGESKSSDDSELSHAVLQIMKSLERHVNGAAKALTDPGFSQLFLMNNYWYIYVNVCKSMRLKSLLGEDWLENYREKAKEYALMYQREAWGSVLQHLSKENLTSRTKSSKVLVTLELQKIRAFQLAFEGAYQRHRGWYIPDVELRDRLTKAVVKLVMPAYRAYLDRFSSLLRQNRVPLELKYSPDMIQQMLSNLFNEKPVDSSNHVLGDKLKRSRSSGAALSTLQDGVFARSISIHDGRIALQLY